MSKIIQISWVSHNAAFTSAFTKLRVQNTFCDVTVCSRGNYFPAHRLILSAFSDYFKEILEQMPCKHPFIMVQGANGEDLKALLDFIYGGEISVESERMESFLKLAQNLEVRGFISSIKVGGEQTTSCPAPPSEFCVNMTELGKRVQTPGVEESYEVPEPSTKKNWGPKSKRKRGKEPQPCEESVKDSSPPPKTVKETLAPEKMVKEPSPPKKKVRETSPPRKIVKEISPSRKTGKEPLPPTKTLKPKQGKGIKESTPPTTKMIEPKQEPLDDFQMTTETDNVKTLKNFAGKPMVVIESCAAAVELSRTPKDGQVSVMIPPMENCITLDSDDDFFDDDFPSDPSSSLDAESTPTEKSASKDEEKLKGDDVQGTNKGPRNIRNSETSKSKRTKNKDTQKQEDTQENRTLSPGSEHHTQEEHFQFAVKEEGELDCQNEITSAATSNHSPVQKREALRVTFKVKDKGEMSYDIVSPKDERVLNESVRSSSAETSSEAGTSKEGDKDDKKKSWKKKKGKKESFHCQYCSYKTPIAVNLRVHLRIHTGEKPFVCSLCPYKSTQGSALRTHMQTHVQNKGVKCPHCEFKTRYGHDELKEHLKSHTDTTTYECEECTFITNRYQTLQRHELKHHSKPKSILGDEDSSQPKKIVKKSNPYTSRKRSLISKKLMAKRKQKEKSSVARKSTASKINVSKRSTSFNTNENFTPENKMEEEIDPLFDSPKIKLPYFKGFADTKASRDTYINPSDSCDAPSPPSFVTTSSLVTPSCATIIPSVSICTTSNTPKIQSSTKEIPNVSTCVTTNTSTTLTTIYPKVLANTSTTLCLLRAVSQPPVLEVDPLSRVPSVRGIQLISLQNSICHPSIISSNSTQGANEEPFLLPKVTNVYGRVPFPPPSTLSASCAEGTTAPLINLESIPSPEDSLSNDNVELNDPLSFSPQAHCEDSIHDASPIENLQEENPTSITITSVSSGVAFNEAPHAPCVDTPSTKDQFNNTSNTTEGPPCVPRASIPSTEAKSPPCVPCSEPSTEDDFHMSDDIIEVPPSDVPCPDPSTEDDFNMSEDVIEVPPCDAPCSDAPSTEDPFNNTSEDVDGPQIRITSISTCSGDDSF